MYTMRHGMAGVPGNTHSLKLDHCMGDCHIECRTATCDFRMSGTD